MVGGFIGSIEGVIMGQTIITTRHLLILPLHQLRQLGEVARHPPRLVTRQAVHRHLPLRFVLEVKIAERLPVLVANDQAPSDRYNTSCASLRFFKIIAMGLSCGFPQVFP
jgi:hypothetical protein